MGVMFQSELRAKETPVEETENREKVENEQHRQDRANQEDGF
jgi:hypothetical protein